MNRVLVIMTLFTSCAFGQSFAPEPGAIGSTAIHKDSSVFVAWASYAFVQRGNMDCQNPSLGFASQGFDSDALGQPDNAVVSLGDGGIATIEFHGPIQNGPGPDFAVFENGFIDHYMELAFVEVSSDGVNFTRFDATSEIPTDVQLSNFSTSNCAYVNNLAGKYRVEYGTPFDLQELDGIQGLDINNVTHIRIIDVVGSIGSTCFNMDSQGNKINDPFPTPYPSGGFDLDAIGVMYQDGAGLNELSDLQIYPNPATEYVQIHAATDEKWGIYSVMGELIERGTGEKLIWLTNFKSGVYYLNTGRETRPLTIIK